MSWMMPPLQEIVFCMKARIRKERNTLFKKSIFFLIVVIICDNIIVERPYSPKFPNTHTHARIEHSQVDHDGMKKRKNPYSSLTHFKGHANRRIVFIGCLLSIAMTSTHANDFADCVVYGSTWDRTWSRKGLAPRLAMGSTAFAPCHPYLLPGNVAQKRHAVRNLRELEVEELLYMMACLQESNQVFGLNPVWQRACT